MSPLPLASVALLGLLLTAPSAAQASSSAANAAHTTKAAAKKVTGSEVPEGFKFAPDGTTLIHVASGLRFPAQVEGFTRLKEQAFDTSGDYVAIGYDHLLNEGKDHLIVRMAVVHIDDMPAKDHYTIMRQQTMSHFSAPQIVSEGPVTVPNNPNLDAYRGIFSGNRNNVPWRFSLTTANYGYWSGRLTAAYPESDAAEAEKYLDGLLVAIRAQTPLIQKHG
ncbi:hypothetical protein EDF56_102543 [Novosphingobium sp. PhB165]|jgi:hypothetical protein|uniref:hypothetical protein n=1 Tax=Novosphingobium sp. PhB165 TaxID=2485105 RepID=UPI0010E8CCF3|nr:hypothetical protein [Novosphingobium sp. PhB165]TCM20880.1 hypothetical protein EDF56_102543 [Novosphingobium sp. PhB165]